MVGTGPIFIGGLSYSGKTYLRLMLLANPNLMITRRTKMWTRYYNRFGDLGTDENFERCLQIMMQAKHIQDLQPDPDRIRREFWQGAPTYGRLFALFHAHHAESAGRPRWGDQLGRVEAFADPIFAAYPNAKMIHMVRDPRARTAESLISSRYRRAKLGWETAAWRWSARLAKRNAGRYPDRYQIIHFEALLGSPEETMRQVCGFIDESFLPSMLTVENVPGLPHGINPSENGGEIDTIFNNREVALLQAGAGKEMAAFDYHPRPLTLSVEDYIALPTVDGPLNLAGQALWWLQEGRNF